MEPLVEIDRCYLGSGRVFVGSPHRCTRGGGFDIEPPPRRIFKELANKMQ